MSLYSQFSTNKEREVAGITVEYHDETDVNAAPASFRVARSGGSNMAYQKAMDRETRPIRRAIANDAISVERLSGIARKVWIETCLLGWENIKGKDGNLLPFSIENATRLFTDLPDLYDDLTRQSGNAGLFREDLLADAKN
jgi:hypothetical protein